MHPSALAPKLKTATINPETLPLIQGFRGLGSFFHADGRRTRVALPARLAYFCHVPRPPKGSKKWNPLITPLFPQCSDRFILGG